MNSEHVLNAKIMLNKKITRLYDRRSGFAHQGIAKKEISVSHEDYLLASQILRLVLFVVLGLYNNGNGILYREARTEDPEKSLEEYVRKIKYGDTPN